MLHAIYPYPDSSYHFNYIHSLNYLTYLCMIKRSCHLWSGVHKDAWHQKLIFAFFYNSKPTWSLSGDIPFHLLLHYGIPKFHSKQQRCYLLIPRFLHLPRKMFHKLVKNEIMHIIYMAYATQRKIPSAYNYTFSFKLTFLIQQSLKNCMHTFY